MGVHIFLVLLGLMQSNWIYCKTTSVAGSVSENVTFIHGMFPVEPSKRAKIQVDVFLQNLRSPDVCMEIHTTQDDVNIKRQCTERLYGQVRNRDLHACLIEDSGNDAPLKCDSVRNNTMHCRGTIRVQDFIPRHFSFSFGFRCEEINATSSIKGISYNMSIFLTNATDCSQLDVAHHSVCSYSEYGVFPNLIGSINKNGIPLDLMLRSSECYQHSRRFLCDLYILRCDPKTNDVIPPCREMCHDYLHGCSHIAQREWKYINCDYLPSTNDAIHCLDKKVLCPDPPAMEEGGVTVSDTKQRNYSAEYKCKKLFYSVTGNSTIYCLYNGSWSSEPPVCDITPTISKFVRTWWFWLLLFCIMIILLRIILCFVEPEEKLDKEPRLTYHKKLPLLSRKRAFDAFVLYHFDSDESFIINNLLPELEETRDFKLCIHSRNFTIGRSIEENIKESIDNSNSAIIVMSQGFVDSIWCKEEFTHCYLENEKDAAFNLLVIMMQPEDSLINISKYMRKYFITKTYLDVKDPEFFTKLATSLNRARKPKNMHENDNSDEERVEEFRLFWPDDEALATKETAI